MPFLLFSIKKSLKILLVVPGILKIFRLDEFRKVRQDGQREVYMLDSSYFLYRNYFHIGNICG